MRMMRMMRMVGMVSIMCRMVWPVIIALYSRAEALLLMYSYLIYSVNSLGGCLGAVQGTRGWGPLKGAGLGGSDECYL
jgi:hypothetical protein